MNILKLRTEISRIRINLKVFFLNLDTRVRIKQPTVKGIFFIIVLIGPTPQIFAVESLGTTIDCSNVKVNYTNNPDWTQNERIEAMDKAFFESVDRFELCNLSNQANKSGSSSKGAGQASNAGSAESKSEGEAESEGEGEGNESRSTASSTMMGTEKQTEAEKNSRLNDYDRNENISKEAAKKNAGYQSNGASPKDIPNADNDDIIASQIRVAAEIEKDPVKKKKLWNEYRKYKGLSTQ